MVLLYLRTNGVDLKMNIFANSKKLSDADKDKLWKDYISTHNMELRNKIIEEYAYLVKVIANKMTLYLGSNVEYDDLCSYGIMGLIDAIDKFDLSANVKFDTYASLRIRGAILDNIRKMDWIPRLLRERQKKIKDAIAACRDKGSTYPTDEEIATELGVDVETYLDWETQLLGTNVFSIEGAMDSEEKDSVAPISVVEQTVYTTPEEHIDKEDLKRALAESLSNLTEKEQRVIQLIYYEDLTAKEVSVVLEVSESRVSQIHTKALGKMKGTMGKYMGLLVPA